MAKVRVTVVHPGGSKKTTVELPDNVPCGRVAQALVRRLGYPLRGQDGQAITYRLINVRQTEEIEINSDRTLTEAGVQTDAVLRMYADMRAGSPGRPDWA